MQLYVVIAQMSSPYRVAETQHPDEDTVMIRYKYPAEVRKQIRNTRDLYKRRIEANTVSFYGLRIANEELLEKVREIVTEADKELKKIDPGLSARLIAIPISGEAIKRGEIYQKLIYAIQYQIIKKVHDRIKDIKSGILKPETRKSVKEMLEDLRKLNILNDPEIDRTIDSIESMLTLTTNELREKIMDQLKYIEELLKA